jgi:hypothetical protein
LGKQDPLSWYQPSKAAEGRCDNFFWRTGAIWRASLGCALVLAPCFFARSAAETAKLVRQEMQRSNLHEYLAVIVARFQEFLLLMRLAKWELAQMRAGDLSYSLTWATFKWGIVLGSENKNRLSNAHDFLQKIMMKLNESAPRGPDEKIKKDIISSAELTLELIIKTQGEISQELETTGVKHGQ